MVKKIIPWLLLVAVLVFISYLVLKPDRQKLQSIKMPDGSVVTFIQATYGSNHTLVWGKSYQKLLYKVLPANVKSWAKCTVDSESINDTNHPMIWLHKSKSPNSLDFAFIDEYGCEHDRGSWRGSGFGLPHDAGTIVTYQPEGDYRGKIIGVCLYDSEAKTNRLGVFIIPGMTMAPMPQPAFPLPEPERTADFVCQLKSFTTGLEWSPLTNRNVFSQLVFGITRNGVPVKTWLPTKVTITDARGKRRDIDFPEAARKANDVVVNIDGTMEPSEGPFKIRIELVHKTDFESDELANFTRVPYPGPKETIETNIQASVQGGTLTIKQIYGTETQQPDSFGVFYKSEPGIEMRFSPSSNDVHCDLLQVDDETGKNLNSGTSSWAEEGGGKRYFFFLTRSDTSKYMNLALAVHKSRFVEFSATPVVFQPKASSSQ